MADELTPPDARRPELLVLDTNIWLDWLVFNDPATIPLARAQAHGRIRIIASPPMRAEFADVISRPALGQTAGQCTAHLQCFDRLTSTPTMPGEPSITRQEQMRRFADRCTDPDDRKFIFQALLNGADALLSRDRAVLKLARLAGRDHGLLIATLTDWSRLAHD